MCKQIVHSGDTYKKDHLYTSMIPFTQYFLCVHYYTMIASGPTRYCGDRWFCWKWTLSYQRHSRSHYCYLEKKERSQPLQWGFLGGPRAVVRALTQAPPHALTLSLQWCSGTAGRVVSPTFSLWLPAPWWWQRRSIASPVAVWCWRK